MAIQKFKLGSYLYNKKIRIFLIDCDKLLFLKKYKNIHNIIKLKSREKRIYALIYYFFKYRIKYLCHL
jgi:uncharacterized protein YktA (UPF0223 family)